MSKKLTLDLILSETNNKNISNLSILNINGKNINDISILSKFPSLENVSLIKNNIKDLSVFKNLKNIKNLNLKDNKIAEFNQIELLKNCKNLESLCLKENPISNESNYIQKIKEILPQLKILDDIELNKNNNKENKITIKPDNKKINKLNMITNKFIKFKALKNKNNVKNYSPKEYLGSPMRANKLKPINNEINNKVNSSGKKGIKEKINLNYSSGKKSHDSEKNNENPNKNNNNKNNNNNINNEDESFENININDEKEKIENEKDNEEKDNPKPVINKEILNYSFKKKKMTGTVYFRKNKDSNIDANQTLDNIKIDNQLIDTFNDENKTLNVSLTNSRYSRKIIGKFPGTHNLLSQSIRYDDENENEVENNESLFAQKNKLASLKNRLFSKLTNQIYNKKINNIGIKDNEKEKENEKMIIKSIKLLLGNLRKDELIQINNDVINAISKVNK